MKTREEKIRNIAKWALIGFILFGTFLLAPYLKYREADEARAKIQTQIDDKSPKLDAFIHRVMTADQGGTPDSLNFIDAGISNLGGTPSIAEEFGLAVNISTNRAVRPKK